MKLYFDLDGVLADMKGYMNTHNIPYNPDGVRDKSVDIIMWDKIREIPHFYQKLKPVKGSIELFKQLNKVYDCEVLSAIPMPRWNLEGTGEDKTKWCNHYLGKDVKVNICYRKEKQDYAVGRNCVLVDDLGINIEEWEKHGGSGILFKSAKDFDFDKLAKIDEMVNRPIFHKMKNIDKYEADDPSANNFEKGE